MVHSAGSPGGQPPPTQPWNRRAKRRYDQPSGRWAAGPRQWPETGTLSPPSAPESNPDTPQGPADAVPAPPRPAPDVGLPQTLLLPYCCKIANNIEHTRKK